MSTTLPRRTAATPRPDAAVRPDAAPPVTATAVWVAAGVAAAVALALAARSGGAVQAPVLADPGVVTRWGVLAARAGYDLAAIGTIGTLAVVALLLPPALSPTGAAALGSDAGRLIRTCRWWAAAWAVAALLSALFGLSDATGLPVTQVLAPDVLPLIADLPATRAMLSSAWLAGLVAVGTGWTRSPAGARVLLLLAVVALLPPLMTGHAGHGRSEALAIAGLSTHVVAAAVWAGGLVALALHLRRSREVLATALPRYSQVALACFVAVAASGVVIAWLSLASAGQLWSTPYGRLLLLKTAALLALGVLGHQHRRRTVARAVAGAPRAFLALAAAEIVLMAATAGLAVGLARTPPPSGAEHGAVTQARPLDAAEALNSVV